MSSFRHLASMEGRIWWRPFMRRLRLLSRDLRTMPANCLLVISESSGTVAACPIMVSSQLMPIKVIARWLNRSSCQQLSIWAVLQSRLFYRRPYKPKNERDTCAGSDEQQHLTNSIIPIIPHFRLFTSDHALVSEITTSVENASKLCEAVFTTSYNFVLWLSDFFSRNDRYWNPESL